QLRRQRGWPEESLLYFIEKRAPRLEDWQRELIRIVRNVSQYFYPQKQLQMMNEGCATFVHYEIMNRLHDKGLITEGSMLEFLHSHSSVVFQPGFDDPRFSGLNPYALGFAMMSDIKRICEDPTDEDREFFPEIAGGGDRCLVLAHYVHDGVLLEEKTCRSVLRYAAQLWGYTVKLLEIEAATDKTLKTYESSSEGK